MSKRKILFLDRDGTLIVEPADAQIDSLEKLQLIDNVIASLQTLQQAGFELVMVSNQDGLGSAQYPEASFQQVQTKLLDIFKSQNIIFQACLICPHHANQGCQCRKPNLGLVLDYLRDPSIDYKQSYVIGDRDTDRQLAENMGIPALIITADNGWQDITRYLTTKPRQARIQRETRESVIKVSVNLDDPGITTINTGIGFFDHMLMQLATHSQIGMSIHCEGDLHIDEHHSVEDTAIALGMALHQALADKRGIQRYGFLLPMDEALIQVALDLSGRGFLNFSGYFHRASIGHFATEMVKHFFQSWVNSLQATLHIKFSGENTHHQIEGIFKAVGKSLSQAVKREGCLLPSSKGVL